MTRRELIEKLIEKTGMIGLGITQAATITCVVLELIKEDWVEGVDERRWLEHVVDLVDEWCEAHDA